MGKVVHENVTAALIAAGGDFNSEDQVYRTDQGMIVKVKVLHDETYSSPGNEIFRVAGAECDERGKALIRDGRPAVHQAGRHVVVASFSAVDLTTLLEVARMDAVDDTVRAAEHYRNRNLTGVGSLADYAARRGA